jgi:hypothetical protein
MSVININLAERAGARLVIGVAGISGSGKTRTALEMAYGLANYDSKKIGFLDTENKRGSLYADVLKNDKGEVQRFYIGDLQPPFSPQRYIDAILQFQNAGVEVLIIDSGTHEWEGSGGCEEIAETKSRGGMKDWATAKGEHKRFMNALLQSDMHIILCLRAREKVEVSKVEGKTVVTPLGIMPVTEKNVMFEMTASLLMMDSGKQQMVMKCPEELSPILGRQAGYITAADGKALRDWVDGAKAIDKEVEHARNSLQTITEQGAAKLGESWAALPKRVQKILDADGTKKTLKASAEAYDRQRAVKEQGGAAVADLNDQLGINTNVTA